MSPKREAQIRQTWDGTRHLASFRHGSVWNASLRPSLPAPSSFDPSAEIRPVKTEGTILRFVLERRVDPEMQPWLVITCEGLEVERSRLPTKD